MRLNNKCAITEPINKTPLNDGEFTGEWGKNSRDKNGYRLNEREKMKEKCLNVFCRLAIGSPSNCTCI